MNQAQRGEKNEGEDGKKRAETEHSAGLAIRRRSPCIDEPMDSVVAFRPIDRRNDRAGTTACRGCEKRLEFH